MLDIRPLPENLKQIARDELNETPERMETDVETFREWIKSQPHLVARMDDQFLIGFLRCCKYSMEKAKSKIDKYYTMKTKYPEYYTVENIDDPRMKELSAMAVGLHLPTPLFENGPRIQYVRPGLYPTDRFNFMDIMCLTSDLQILSVLVDDYCVVSGFVQLIDLTDYTMEHMLQMTPTVIKKMLVFIEEALPLRQKSIHIINAPAGFDRLFQIIKPLMPQKQQERVFVHGHSLETFYEHIPLKYLPKELGGKNGTLDEINKAQIKTLADNHDFFVSNSKYCVKEELRMDKQTNGDEFGADGSFRKLEVD